MKQVLATLFFLSVAPALANESSLLTPNELEGGALVVEAPLSSGARHVNTAMLAALQAQDQLRRVELFLKSGSAQSGDLRVVEARAGAQK